MRSLPSRTSPARAQTPSFSHLYRSSPLTWVAKPIDLTLVRAAAPLQVEEDRRAVVGLDHAVEIRLVRHVRSATRPVGAAHPARDPALAAALGDQEVLALDAALVVQLDEPGLRVVERQAVQRLKAHA